MPEYWEICGCCSARANQEKTMNRRLVFAFLFVGLGCLGKGVAAEQKNLPDPPPEFKGVIAPDYRNSKPEWPKTPAPPAGAPNIVIILLDDFGFGQASTFGGPIPMPNLDKLAAAGLRYNRFHNAGLSSPTRAALLTGRNPHQASAGSAVEWATGYPGYDAMIPDTTATIAQVLRYYGYRTAWIGKNHNTPAWEASVAGPFTQWPTGLGFDYFYGFNGAATDNWYPALFENTRAVEPARSPEQGYHLVADLTDKALDWLRYQKSVTPGKPFFLYFSPGATHAPQQAPREWREKFKGQFDKGWDVTRDETYQRQLKLGIIPADARLTPRPAEIPAWDSLSPEEQRFSARLMENFAASAAFADYQIGRLLQGIQALPEADNTLVFYIAGDNGPSASGGVSGTANEVASSAGQAPDLQESLKRLDEIGEPGTEPNYPVGWAWAGTTPLPGFKQVASHFGDTRSPMVVAWPARIKDAGGLRSQWGFVTDIAPTVYEAAGVQLPKAVEGIKQTPLAGKSLLYSFGDAGVRSTHTTQYFEVLGNRALLHENWVLAARHAQPWEKATKPFDDDKWELYNVADDFSEAIDLAALQPDKVKELRKVIDREFKANNVYPLDDRGAERLEPSQPQLSPPRDVYTYFTSVSRLPQSAGPPLANRSYKITVDAVMPDDKPEGVLVASGGSTVGFTLYVYKGKLIYHYNFFDRERFTIACPEWLKPGPTTIVFDFQYDGGGPGKGGTGTLLVDGLKVGEGRLEQTVDGAFGTDCFGIGVDTGSPVSSDYAPPFAFNGEIKKVQFELGPVLLKPEDAPKAPQKELKAAQAQK